MTEPVTKAGGNPVYSGEQIDKEPVSMDAERSDENVQQIMKIPINVQFVLGSSRFLVEELIKLTPQQVIATGTKADDKIDLIANGRVIARGELVVMDEDTQQLGLMISSVVDRPSS